MHALSNRCAISFGSQVLKSLMIVLRSEWIIKDWRNKNQFWKSLKSKSRQMLSNNDIEIKFHLDTKWNSKIFYWKSTGKKNPTVLKKMPGNVDERLEDGLASERAGDSVERAHSDVGRLLVVLLIHVVHGQPLLYVVVHLRHQQQARFH